MGFYYDEPEDCERDLDDEGEGDWSNDEEVEEDMPSSYYDSMYDDDLIDDVGFADPGGNSSLRAATPNNPRIHPCPTCGAPSCLTPLDVAAGYQCNACANRDERGGP